MPAARADGGPDPPRPRAREVRLRSIRSRDVVWLTLQGLAFSKIGSQYHWAETPLQLLVAPLRAVSGPRRSAALIEVDGRRAGYIGPNPLSGNIEYFVAPWARGGVGTASIATYLREHRRGDRARAFFVAHHNQRSLRALVGAFEQVGWTERRDYRVDDGKLGWRVRVRPGPRADDLSGALTGRR